MTSYETLTRKVIKEIYYSIEFDLFINPFSFYSAGTPSTIQADRDQNSTMAFFVNHGSENY